MNLPPLNWKKILLVLGLLAVAGGLLWLMILILIGGPQPAEPEPVSSPSGQLPITGLRTPDLGEVGQLPTTETKPSATERATQGRDIDTFASGGETQVLPVTDDRVRSPELSFDGRSFVYYDENEERFYKVIIATGERILLSDERFFQVAEVSWSPDQTEAVLEYPDGATVHYDFKRKKATTLPAEVTDVDFTQRGERIAFKFESTDPNNSWLAIARPDGSGAQQIEPIGDKGSQVQVAWSPTGEVVALFHKSLGLDREEVFFIGTKGENFKSLVVDGSQFKGLWSPRGDRLLYQVVATQTNYNPSLWVVDAQGENIGRNKFSLGVITWVDKCVFAQNNRIVYCAVPLDLPAGAGLVPEVAADLSYEIWQINLDSGLKNRVALPVSDETDKFAIEKLFINPNGERLFFWDTLSGRLYQLRLR